MATTTNYGWTTPDDTALVKDGASAIRSLGTSIDTTTKNLNPSTTLGDIEYRSSTANTNTRLGIGTTGQVLTVSGGVPAWTTFSGGGKVLQVLQTVKDDTFTSSSTTFADITGLSVSITPSSATSKILVMAHLTICGKVNTNVAVARLMRGSTAIYAGIAASSRSSGFYNNIPANDDVVGAATAVYLDSPATTSSTTYKVQGLTNTGTFYVNRSANDNDASYSVRSVSSITVMEIGA